MQVQFGVISAVGTPPAPPVPDFTPPSEPTNLSATAISPFQIDLAWSAATDNVRVAGYQVFRDGTPIATVTTTSYADTGLSPSTTYTYTVSAFDAAGTESLQTSPSVSTTQSCTSCSQWTDYRVRLTMRSDDNDALGVMFHYQNNNNYYRFSWNRQSTYRRLMKRENGVVTLLAEDAVPYVVGQTYQVEIVAQGPQLEVWIDGAQIFAVTDTSIASGTISLYSWRNDASIFDDVVVEELATGTVLLADDFNDGEFTGWTVVDEGTLEGPSAWSAATGTLVQSSNVFSTPTDASNLVKLGTFALYTAGGE